MGIQLRETLRRFCDEIGWSYAVFWAPICRGDHMQLVWGDGYCEQGHDGTGMSEVDADGHVSGRGFQAKQRVGLLVYKMLASEIHVVGDGIVGQAAFTGNHKWILHNALGNYASVTKALGTMNHQFSAGIQTIAIIPVLPHGVLQIGSTQMVMENKEFINHVRSLFVELGTVPGALVFDASQKPLIHNILQNASLEASSTLSQPGDTGTYMSRFLNGRLDKSHRQFLQVPYSRSVTQPSGSIFRHAYCSMPDNSANMSSTTATTIHPVDDLIYHHNQLESGNLGSHSIFTNPAMTSVENEVYDLSSVSPHHVHILSGLSSNGQAMLEEQLLSRSGSQEYIKKYWPKLDNYGTSQLKSSGCTFSTSNKDLDTTFPLGRSKSNNIEDLGQCSSLPGCTGHFQSQLLNSSSKEVRQMVDLIDHSQNAGMLSKDSELSFSNSIQNSGKIPTEGQQRNDYNIIHSLLESTQFEEQQSRHELLLSTPLDCWQSSSVPVQESTRSLSSVSGENHASTANSPNIPGIDTHLQFVNTETSLSPVRFTSGNGLFDLLDAPNKSRDIHGCLDDVFLEGNKANAHEMCSDVSTCITQRDMGAVIDNEQNCCDELFSQASPEQLLDAVVAQITSAAKQTFDDVSCNTLLTKSCHPAQHTSSTASGWLGSSNQMHGKLSDTSSMPVKSEAAGSSSLKSACGMDKTGVCTPKDGLYKSKLSLLVGKGENVDQGSFSAAHGKRIDEVGKSNKKRSRPGENPRPRPKDRQMIQDRVKELREIVPNGAKCSIDALLEKTIKHMLFLQSVTKHADKLKEVGEPKIVSKEGGLLLKDNFDGGATWAFEIGTQSMICPIIVEDLNVPRQMLVEMLCEEQGLFLEIADLIRGLGLTILKGVLEARKDKVWARFAVEANRDVTRMEIFLSLVRLLEPNAGTSTVPDGVESFNKPHNVFHPFSLRAAGLSDCM